VGVSCHHVLQTYTVAAAMKIYLEMLARAHLYPDFLPSLTTPGRSTTGNVLKFLDASRYVSEMSWNGIDIVDGGIVGWKYSRTQGASNNR